MCSNFARLLLNMLVLGAPRAPAFFLVSLRSASVPIGGGCHANVELTTGSIPFHSLDPLGTATIPLALDDYPKAYIGNAHFQWAYVNNGQLLTTKGFEVRIRP